MSNFHDLINNSEVVLTTDTHKYLKFKNFVMPIVMTDKGYGVIRTVLTSDMEIKPD